MNSNEPAFPMVASTGDPRDGVYCANGLSKREYAAIQALKGLLANPHWNRFSSRSGNAGEDRIEEIAVRKADVLFAELERKTE